MPWLGLWLGRRVRRLLTGCGGGEGEGGGWRGTRPSQPPPPLNSPSFPRAVAQLLLGYFGGGGGGGSKAAQKNRVGGGGGGGGGGDRGGGGGGGGGGGMGGGTEEGSGRNPHIDRVGKGEEGGERGRGARRGGGGGGGGGGGVRGGRTGVGVGVTPPSGPEQREDWQLMGRGGGENGHKFITKPDEPFGEAEKGKRLVNDSTPSPFPSPSPAPSPIRGEEKALPLPLKKQREDWKLLGKGGGDHGLAIEDSKSSSQSQMNHWGRRRKARARVMVEEGTHRGQGWEGRGCRGKGRGRMRGKEKEWGRDGEGECGGVGCCIIIAVFALPPTGHTCTGHRVQGSTKARRIDFRLAAKSRPGGTDNKARQRRKALTPVQPRIPAIWELKELGECFEALRAVPYPTLIP
ncbi:hypothetical protein BDK51DRAFT_26420 [Blyttiomyces helicus]|uniref:Uncharacterized protein n=1 Tax=Blyttiomyces helicus TaxID=388810 RepID=A0A4P9WKI8_9FUNG|nr:hypothetical protein BDK51DRAFT_26420 [Blyttiomyces helicus]|eukprot:RKO92912.1 hypothetical protein BDK51DRAFT_26420 [Blyttiomyces helicus]